MSSFVQADRNASNPKTARASMLAGIDTYISKSGDHAGIPDKRKLREGDVEETGGESKKISSSKPGKTTSKAPKTPVLAADSEDNSPAESKTQLTMDALTKAKAELQTRKRELERVNEEIRAQTEKIEAEIKEHFASSPGYQREIMDRALSQLSVKIVGGFVDRMGKLAQSMSTAPTAAEDIIKTLMNTQGGACFKKLFEEAVANRAKTMETELDDILEGRANDEGRSHGRNEEVRISNKDVHARTDQLLAPVRTESSNGSEPIPNRKQHRHDEPVKLRLSFPSDRGSKRPLFGYRAEGGEHAVGEGAFATDEILETNPRKKSRRSHKPHLKLCLKGVDSSKAKGPSNTE